LEFLTSQMMSLARVVGNIGVAHAARWNSPKMMVCRSFAQLADGADTRRKVWGVEYVSKVRYWEKEQPKTRQSQERSSLPLSRSCSESTDVAQIQRQVWGVQYVSDMRPWDQEAAKHTRGDADCQ